MAEIAKSDVFFFITSVSVVILTIIIVVLLTYLFMVIRDIKDMVRKVKQESDEVLEDIRELRARLKAESGAISRASAIASFFKSTFFGKRNRSKK